MLTGLMDTGRLIACERDAVQSRRKNDRLHLLHTYKEHEEIQEDKNRSFCLSTSTCDPPVCSFFDTTVYYNSGRSSAICLFPSLFSFFFFFYLQHCFCLFHKSLLSLVPFLLFLSLSHLLISLFCVFLFIFISVFILFSLTFLPPTPSPAVFVRTEWLLTNSPVQQVINQPAIFLHTWH